MTQFGGLDKGPLAAEASNLPEKRLVAEFPSPEKVAFVIIVALYKIQKVKVRGCLEKPKIQKVVEGCLLRY